MNRSESHQKEIEQIKEELKRYKSEGIHHLKELREYMKDSSKWIGERVQR